MYIEDVMYVYILEIELYVCVLCANMVADIPEFSVIYYIQYSHVMNWHESQSTRGSRDK